MFQVKSQQIFDILEKTENPSHEEVFKILEKAQLKQGLEIEEVGMLINTQDPDLIEKMEEVAHQIKLEIYGPRLVLFAPLYVSSYCVNDCEYCGFHLRNSAPRKKLTLEEVKEQVEILEEMGHKRLLLEFGEHPQEAPIDYVVEVIKTIYSVKKDQGSIRRVNVNIAATTRENYKKLKEAGIGTYQLFQETYHEPTYKTLHQGAKADFIRQLTAHERAFEAGIDDLGFGVLFGLYDWRYEVLALVAHAQYFDKTYGVGPHTISVPRFRPAETVDFQPAYEVSDDDFLKLIAILRLSVPYTGMIMSTRENPEIRRQAFSIGISQTSAASKTAPGGYKKLKAISYKLNAIKGLAQFSLSDERSLDEVVYDILKIGYFPSFCTACYRQGRTGRDFMPLAKSGKIQEFCRPNAILTFKEYLLDYAGEATRKLGEEAIEGEMEKISNQEIQTELLKRLKRLEEGERDLYF